MVDSSTEKLYTGLLAVGDEILEVNGERVASLSLDQVTNLLTRNTSATVRVHRDWRMPPCWPQHWLITTNQIMTTHRDSTNVTFSDLVHPDVRVQNMVTTKRTDHLYTKLSIWSTGNHCPYCVTGTEKSVQVRKVTAETLRVCIDDQMISDTCSSNFCLRSIHHLCSPETGVSEVMNIFHQNVCLVKPRHEVLMKQKSLFWSADQA